MSSSELDPRRFLLALVGTAAAAMAALLLATLLVDPFAQMPGGPQICAPGVKVSLPPDPLAPLTQQPDELFFGSSRVQGGISAEDARAVAGPRVASFTLAGASLSELDQLIRRAVEARPPRRVWIGLDFAMFLPAHRPRRQAPRIPLSSTADRWRYALFNMEAIRATLSVARHPERCRQPLADSHGFTLPTASVAASPEADRERFNERGIAAGLASHLRSGGGLRRTYRTSMERLAVLLSDLRRRGVEVVIFLGPIHPGYERALEQAGLRPLYAAWRRDVAGAARQVRLIDRAGPVAVSPACMASSAPQCPFNDLMHYRSILGREILWRFRSRAAPSSQP